MKGKKNQYWLRSGTFAMILNVQTIIFSFGGFYFLVHLLDKSSFGVWSLFWQRSLSLICFVAAWYKAR